MPDLEIPGRGSSFFVELFGTDIGPGKQYREISKNAFEGIDEYKKTHPEDRDYEPVVEAFVDPYTFSETGATKFAFGDNGIGMTHATMSELYKIFHSTKTQSLEENYGIGARAATLKFNPEGVEFRTWRDGKGYVTTLARLREENGIPIYGTLDETFTDEHGNVLAVKSTIPLEEPYFSEDEVTSMKPPFIKDHGTVVVLHGRTEGDDTTLMPDELRDEIGTDGRSREHTSYWQTHLYNSQYFTIPDGVKFRLYVEPGAAMESKPKVRRNMFHGDRTLRLVKGTKDYLDNFGEKRGTVAVPGATVYWWILGEGDEIATPQHLNKETGKPMTKADKRKRQRVWFPWLTGTMNHAIVSAIHQGEQFDLATKVEAVRLLQKFGIFAGHNNICIVVEPDADVGVRSNMNRTSLMVNQRRLPWERWGHEFAQRYPQDAPELLAYIEMKLGNTDFDTELDRLLAEMKDDFTVPTAAPRKAKNKVTEQPDPLGVVKPGGGRVPSDPDKPRRPRPEPDPERVIVPRGPQNGKMRYRVIETGKKNMLRHENEPRPAVKLFTDHEYNYAFRGRAAEYVREGGTVYASGIIYINRDFDVMEKLIDESVNLYFQTDEAREKAWPIVRSIVELVYSAQILFAVMTYRHSFMIGHGTNWSEEESRKLVSPEALTAIVLARPGMREQIKRRINSRADLKLLMMRNADEIDALQPA